MKQLGLNPHRLEVPGRKRLDIDHGKPIDDIIASRSDWEEVQKRELVRAKAAARQSAGRTFTA